MTITVGRGTTSQQRRESAAERLSVMAAVLDAFDADVAARPPAHVGALDRSRLRQVVRAMLPLALDDPTFDVTVTAGPTGVAVRVHHPAGLGPVARLVSGSVADDPPVVEDPQAAESAASPVAWQLAELLRRGRLGPR